MNWADFWAALALVMVLEGLIPFLSPRGYQKMVQQMAVMPESSLRKVGLVLMVGGILFLYPGAGITVSLISSKRWLLPDGVPGNSAPRCVGSRIATSRYIADLP